MDIQNAIDLLAVFDRTTNEEMKKRYSGMDWKRYRALSTYDRFFFHTWVGVDAELYGGEPAHIVMNRIATEERSFPIYICKEGERYYFESVADVAKIFDKTPQVIGRYKNSGKQVNGFTFHSSTRVEVRLSSTGEVLEVSGD